MYIYHIYYNVHNISFGLLLVSDYAEQPPHKSLRMSCYYRNNNAFKHANEYKSCYRQLFNNFRFMNSHSRSTVV